MFIVVLFFPAHLKQWIDRKVLVSGKFEAMRNLTQNWMFQLFSYIITNNYYNWKKFFRWHIWDNHWDCTASVKVIFLIHLSTTLHEHIKYTHHSFHGNTWAQCIDLLMSKWLHIPQFVGALHQLCRGLGFESHWRHRQKNFSGAICMRQSLRLSGKCEDHFFNSIIIMLSLTFFIVFPVFLCCFF